MRTLYRTYINVPVSKVYETITTAEGWDKWFTHGMELDLEKKTILFRWKDFGVDKATLEDGGKIIDFKQDKYFIFQWQPISYPITVKLLLEKRGEGTVISAEEDGMREDAEGIGRAIDGNGGWAEALTLLKFYLEHGVTYGIVPDL